MEEDESGVKVGAAYRGQGCRVSLVELGLGPSGP